MGGATRGGTAEPTLRDQIQGKNEDRKSHREEEFLRAQTEAPRQSREAPSATKQNEESSTCTWTGDYSCHAKRSNDGGG